MNPVRNSMLIKASNGASLLAKMKISNGVKKLVLIDANALIHRAFHALPPLTTQKGEMVNAVYGFILVLLKMLKVLKPDYIACAFDVAGPTFRDIEYKEYKAKRVKAPDALYNQIDKIKEVVRAFNIPIYEKQGFEADDIIGTVTERFKVQGSGFKVVIVTGDLDTLQLIDKQTSVYTLRKGVKDTVIYDKKAVFERYGLNPSQTIDFKGLRGDPSDNIPGVPGVGEVTAIKLLKEFGSMERLYECLERQKDKIQDTLKKKLLEFKEQAFFSKKLATIKRDVSIKFKLEDCRWGEYDREKVIGLFKELGFYSLIERLPNGPETMLNITQNHAKSFASVLRGTHEVGVSRQFSEPDIYEQIERAYKDGIFSKKVYELEKALVPVIKQMEKVGIKVDTEKLKVLAEDIGSKAQELKSKIYKLAGQEFNIDSPAQLSQILFEKLKISTSGLRKTPGGVISTAASELVKLASKHKITNLILEYRRLTKLKSTYADALPKTVDSKGGRIHTTFHQLGTATGRISSSEPNLQNIPIRGEFGKKIRECFVAKEGFKLISADYSQTELRIIATLAHDKKMSEVFQEGKDIHQATAAFIFDTPEDCVTSSMRRIAKSLNFGIIYGMGPRGVAERTGISRDKAKTFISNYLEKFKDIARFIEATKAKAKTEGYVETLFGRQRFLPEINSRDAKLRAAAERMAVNMPIQGTAADIVKLAMVEVSNIFTPPSSPRLQRRGKKGGARYPESNIQLLLQVHDELVFEAKFDIIEEVVPRIKRIMENVVKLEVPLVVNIKIGQNWGEL